ncbi:MAG: sugar phosphate isomerase/epimerase [Armatimonadetes bacterium]|nr:sugar phosphate isomerase/epimerase [Armatimonadota bacterium]
MKIGYRSPGLRELDFRGKFELCHRLNLTAIEVHLREFDGESPEDVRGLAEEMDIAITAVSGGMNLAVPAAFDEAISVTEDNIALCQALGVDFLFTRSMWPEPEVPQAETWEHLVPATRQIAQMCADGGVKLGLEVDHGCFIDTLERAERYMEAVDHENFYYNYDPTNFYLGGSDPLAVLDRHHERILNGHIKDGVYRYQRREETPIGEGEVPYREIFARMDELGLDIAMNIEHCSSVECVAAGAEFVHGVLADVR